MALGKYFKLACSLARLRFLILVPPCVALGFFAAQMSEANISILSAILALVGALTAHASVNTLNDYNDFKNGLDFITTRTPFSGGSGTLPNNPDAAPFALHYGLVLLGLCALIGVYFLQKVGLGLLLCTLPGALLIGGYSICLVKRPILCLLAPGLGFGPCMVLGTQYALGGAYTWQGTLLSFIPFGVVSALLVMNQLPDKTPDQTVGRSNVVIRYGATSALYITITLWAISGLATILAGIFYIGYAALGAVPGFLMCFLILKRAYPTPEKTLITLLGPHVGAILLMLWGLTIGLIINFYIFAN